MFTDIGETWRSCYKPSEMCAFDLRTFYLHLCRRCGSVVFIRPWLSHTHRKRCIFPSLLNCCRKWRSSNIMWCLQVGVKWSKRSTGGLMHQQSCTELDRSEERKTSELPIYLCFNFYLWSWALGCSDTVGTSGQNLLPQWGWARPLRQDKEPRK